MEAMREPHSTTDEETRIKPKRTARMKHMKEDSSDMTTSTMIMSEHANTGIK